MTNDVATTFAAWFGALGTFGLTVFEIYKYSKDKPNLKIICDFNREIVNEYLDGRTEVDKVQGTIWSITLANIGSKPVILTSVGVENHEGQDAIIGKDSIGNKVKKQKIEPGDSLNLIISEKLLSSKNLKTVVVTSAVGKRYRKRVYFWQKK
ncbi:hypothetical protein A3J19_03575 [Candidatus Daviesbacteria bacterium RIFCSPLOWO2_02_FULL_41_8]|uniref:Uncharacterized protein n=2 Tax=Candidatus Daviesiibacteriota TaxID=1752718 RepID=A0A1F5NHK4_9BACT|nr:MAG: hypothetical protein A3D83_04070 [Candidatus Daviesbacteria bacterium RIFCSPHIGHO2_02_FULL_41_10]OGE76982.1 MAG: hypothetical protein A3J19_03575 [Candidatus Daviesbacteria bacterium RIFCSPLOWO2_02_FULL_41_8]